MPIRNALDDGNLEVILMEARKASEITPDGCWLWKFAKNNAGYPMMGQGGKAGLVHRKITEAVLGQPLGREPVHHKCARPACINPDHLQLTTHRENMAEMLQRRFYRERIADLEQALREISPDHLLLKSSR
jgi:hypothetical protein